MNGPSFLLLTRHYPPDVSGGARRPFALAQGLRARGCRVRTVAPALPAGEDGVAVPHPAGTQRDVAEPPSQSRPVRDIARRELLLPDPDIRWAMRAVCAVKDERADVVLSTSPPESVHVAAAWLAQRWDATLVCDFRDHWLTHALRPERSHPVRRWRERRIARRLLDQADLALAVDESIAAELGELAPHAAVRVLAQPVPDMDDGGSAPPTRERGPVMVHTGSFSLSHRTRRVADALSAFAETQSVVPDLRLCLAGRLTAEEAATVAGHPLNAAIDLVGPVGMAEARALQRDADLLLLVTAPDAVAVPGKLHEYLATSQPIVAVASPRVSAAVPEGRGFAPRDAGRALGRRFEPRRLTSAEAADQLLEALGQDRSNGARSDAAL